jgi:hypothetical protein
MYSQEITLDKTIKFVGSSYVQITNVQFTGTHHDEANTVILTLRNTGTKDATISLTKINNNVYTTDPTALMLTAGQTDASLIITSVGWDYGNAYKFDLYDPSGQIAASYQATAPA